MSYSQSSGEKEPAQGKGESQGVADTATMLVKRTSIWSPLFDFWALGGLSILLCLLLHGASFFKEEVPALQMRFMQVVVFFSVLSILCNHPHFLISYRFGYGRGRGFILKNWFALVVVPLSLIALYAVAYFNFDRNISNSSQVLAVNHILGGIGLGFRIGQAEKLGAEIMGLSIWLMYFTVGWHYSKQIYGCMMVGAFYDGYRLAGWQKSMLKWSVFSVAIYQFIYMSGSMDRYAAGGSIQDPRFQGFAMASLGLPGWMLGWSAAGMIALAIGVVAVLGMNFQRSRQLPSWNFLVPWIAFYVWWVPMGNLPEYYLLMVPFFHSLQYLAFALRVENQKIKKHRRYSAAVSLRVIALLAAGLLAFELIPSFLDKKMETEVHQAAWFFTAAFAVFINIHHFFIDSVSWRLRDQEVADGLLFEEKSPA